MWRKFTLNMKYLADSNIETARLLRLTNMIVTIQNNLSNLITSRENSHYSHFRDRGR